MRLHFMTIPVVKISFPFFCALHDYFTLWRSINTVVRKGPFCSPFCNNKNHQARIPSDNMSLCMLFQLKRGSQKKTRDSYAFTLAYCCLDLCVMN